MSTQHVAATHRSEIRAPIVAVTVLEDRASITRKGSLAIAGGQHRITIERVSPVLADKTLFATATGARVIDIRCERHLAPWRDPDGGSNEPPAQLRAERTRLEIERDGARARAETARNEVVAVAVVVATALRDLAVAATRGIGPESAAAKLAELDALESAARVRAIDAELAARDADAAISRLDARLARAERTAGEEAARLVIDVIAEQPSDIVLSVGYVVPGAAWRPYHRAMLDRAAERIEWQTTACVWQATGEDWTDAALACSLERPSLGVDPPELVDDELRTRRRPDPVVVEAREQVHHTTGLGGGPAQVPGIDDGGLGLVLTAASATIHCDGAPHRIVVGGFATAAKLARVAIPLRSPWVHLRARIVNTGTLPLLAGPVDLIMSSGYVGRAEIGFVAAGERFYLGFGPDADIRMHRSETRERDDAGLLGGWNVQTVRVSVRLSNLGGDKHTIAVTERIPISEVEQVEVHATAPDAYLLSTDDHPGGEEITQVTARAIDDERGMVTWDVELPPFGRRAVALEYRVKSQRGVAGI